MAMLLLLINQNSFLIRDVDDDWSARFPHQHADLFSVRNARDRSPVILCPSCNRINHLVRGHNTILEGLAPDGQFGRYGVFYWKLSFSQLMGLCFFNLSIGFRLVVVRGKRYFFVNAPSSQLLHLSMYNNMIYSQRNSTFILYSPQESIPLSQS